MSGMNIFVGTGLGLWNGGGVYLSTNNGDNWTAVNTGLTDSVVRHLAVCGSNIFAGTAHGVFVTTNNGTNWKEANAGLTDSVITALTVKGAYLFAGTGSGVWKRPLSEMIVDVPQSTNQLPGDFLLEQNYPNPFNPATTISYQLPTQSHVVLKVFDVLGKEIATLVNGVEEAGYKSVLWELNNLPGGVYFYRIVTRRTDAGQTRSYTKTKKLLLLK
jgi:hypothetical protein